AYCYATCVANRLELVESSVHRASGYVAHCVDCDVAMVTIGYARGWRRTFVGCSINRICTIVYNAAYVGNCIVRSCRVCVHYGPARLVVGSAIGGTLRV